MRERWAALAMAAVVTACGGDGGAVRVDDPGTSVAANASASTAQPTTSTTSPVPSTTAVASTTAVPSSTSHATTTPPAPVTTAPAGPDAHGWTVLDPGPQLQSYGGLSAWTGHEMIEWGGYDANGGLVDGGAAYDPDTRVWRALPSSGFLAAGLTAAGYVATWTGTRLVVIETDVVGVLDVASDTWQRFDSPLPHDAQLHDILLADAEVLVSWDTGPARANDLSALTIGPDAVTARTLPRPPGGWYSPFVVVSGRHVIVVGDPYALFSEEAPDTSVPLTTEPPVTEAPVDTSGDPGFPTIGATPVELTILDLDTGQLSGSTGPPLEGIDGWMTAVGPDGELYVWGADHGDTNPPALRFDVSSSTWSEVPRPVGDWWECTANTALAGRILYIEICDNAQWFLPDENRLVPVDAPPVELPGTPPVWTGEQLLFWGEAFCYACEEEQSVHFLSLEAPDGP